MHEVSLVRELLKQVEEVRRHNGVTCVATVKIEIGPLAGVEPLLVEHAFRTLVADTEFSSARIVIDQPALTALCLACHSDFEVIDFYFRCPSCSSGKVQVTSGDQLRLISITTTGAVGSCALA